MTRRQALRAGGLTALGLVFTKPVIETIRPLPPFAQYAPPVTPTPTPTATPTPLPVGTFLYEWGIQDKTPNLRAIMFLALFHCGLTMSFESLLPVLSLEKLDAGNAGFAYLMMAVGAGALVSSLSLAGIQSEVTRGRLFLYLGLFSGVTPIILGLSTSIPMALVGAALMGVSQAAFMTLTHTMIQSIVTDNVRGRVGGIYSVHIGGMMATANLFNAGLADYLNAPVLLIGGGLAFIAVMLVSWQYRSLRLIYTRGLAPQEAPATAD